MNNEDFLLVGVDFLDNIVCGKGKQDLSVCGFEETKNYGCGFLIRICIER